MRSIRNESGTKTTATGCTDLAGSGNHWLQYLRSSTNTVYRTRSAARLCEVLGATLAVHYFRTYLGMEGPPGTTPIGSHRARKVLRASLLLPQAAALESLPSIEYLERTSVKTFLEDALKQLLVERPESAVRFFDKYFSR